VPVSIFLKITRSRTDGFIVQSLRSAKRCALASLLLLVLFPTSLAPLAFASLGGDLNSVMTDQVHFQGSLNTTEMSSYTVHEIHPQTGIVIREYVSSAGKVFAISWHGPAMPDMKQILGSYFHQYSEAAKSQKASYVGRRPLQITQPDFVLIHGGHMRSYVGKAYLPQMLPSGVTAEDIQ
jgi:hypothetical protein